MIIYNNAFDLYHTIFRMLHLLSRVDLSKRLEVDKIRIWDYYLLFPNEIHKIKPKRNESDFKKILKDLIVLKSNPYQQILDERKALDKIKPYQMSALNCLASYNIIDKELLLQDSIKINSIELLKKYSTSIGELSSRERNVITIVTSSFYDISLFGKNGLKNRTNLIESKYDG